MTDTVIKIPYLIAGLSYTVDVIDPADESVLQAGIVLQGAGTTGTGTVSAAVAAKSEFVIKHDGNIVDVRVRTIADDAGPYRIVTGLDSQDSLVGVALPANPSDDDLVATGWMIAYDHLGQRENGVNITIRMTSGNGTAGASLDTESRSGTTAVADIDGQQVNGYVEFPGMIRGATYSIVRGPVTEATAASPFAVRSAGPSQSVVVPDSPSFALTQVIGQE